jgi:hypothetical protein
MGAILVSLNAFASRHIAPDKTRNSDVEVEFME